MPSSGSYDSSDDRSPSPHTPSPPYPSAHADNADEDANKNGLIENITEYQVIDNIDRESRSRSRSQSSDDDHNRSKAKDKAEDKESKERDDARSSKKKPRKMRSPSRSRSRSLSHSRKRRRSRSRSRRRSLSRTKRFRRMSRECTPPEGARLHIAEVDVETRKRDLEKLFEKYGRLREIWMARNPPCFAFVVFGHQKDADRAMRETDGMVLGNSRIRVTKARPRVRGGRFRGYDPNQRCYQCGEVGHFSRNCTDTKFGYKRPPTPPGYHHYSRSRSRERIRIRRSRSSSRSRRNRKHSRNTSRSRSLS